MRFESTTGSTTTGGTGGSTRGRPLFVFLLVAAPLDESPRCARTREQRLVSDARATRRRVRARRGQSRRGRRLHRRPSACHHRSFSRTRHRRARRRRARAISIELSLDPGHPAVSPDGFCQLLSVRPGTRTGRSSGPRIPSLVGAHGRGVEHPPTSPSTIMAPSCGSMTE